MHARTRQQKAGLALGIMSGTSVDSVDCALCAVASDRVKLRRHWQVRFPDRLRERVLAAARGETASWETAQLHHDLGRFYARAVSAGLGGDHPVVVGLHGQTVFHRPDRRAPATLQLGEPAWLVERLRVPVVSNFRAADLAAGGQGAPLATLFHQKVFGTPGRVVCVHNLGGISNVTLLDWGDQCALRVLSFDTGPANMLLDMAMRHYTRGRLVYDRDGRWAAQGRANEMLLQKWLGHPFFRSPPPKSTGREMFGEPFWRTALPRIKARRLSPYDALATLTELTARSIALNYRLHLHCRPDRLVLSGGGAANPTLVGRIATAFRADVPALEVVTSAALGWPLQAVEPAAFALLAWHRLHGLPGNLPETTGARRALTLGQLAVP